MIRFPIAMWCLAGVVIITAYTAKLKSFLTLTAPKFHSTINTLEELANSNHYKQTSKLNGGFTNLLLVKIRTTNIAIDLFQSLP